MGGEGGVGVDSRNGRHVGRGGVLRVGWLTSFCLPSTRSRFARSVSDHSSAKL